MKKKLLFLVPLISTSMVLTACGGLGGGGEGGNGISLPNTAEQAVNMFYQFASNAGVEITYRVYDDESAQPETYTIGFKNDVFWVKESVAYKKVGTTLESYEYDASKRSYEFQAAVAESGQYSLDYFLKSLTSAFYAGYEYASGSVSAAITAKKDTTFLNRAATEYTFSASAGSATATLNIVFDNATGITLKIYGSASSGGDNSSAEYEVTSFAVGDAVTIPTLNKPSGQGGEGQGGSGETGDESKFVNRKFDCFRDHGATLYTYSSLAIFQDGTFEFSYKENNKLVVYLGEYNIDTTDTVATLSIKKIYKEQTNSYSQVSNNLTWTFTSVQDYFVLTMSASVSLDYEVSNGQPVHADIPDDPNGQAGQDDQRFLVSNTAWASMIEEADVVKMDSNFSARVTTSDNTVGGASYAFDNGKVKYTYKDAYGEQEQYKEYHAEGGFDAYNQDNYGAWVKTSYSAAYGTIASYNESLGIIRVPFDKVTYSSDSHEYVCRSWADSYGTSYENIHIGFDNGKLAKIYYTKWNIRFETEFMLYGTTSVTLPQEGGGNHPTQEQLNDLVRNRVYVYDSAIDNDQKYTAAQLNGFFAGNKISFFTDNSFELTYARLVDLSTGAIQESSMTYIGTYQVQEDSQLVGYNRIVLSIDKVVVDGYLVEDEVDDTMGARIKPNENQVTIWEYDSNADIATYYALNSSATPVHIEYSSEPPVIESKWPAEDIAAKLKQLGVSVTIPAPTLDEQYISSVQAVLPEDNIELSIVITLTDARYTAVLFSQYYQGIQGFAIDYMASEDGAYVLFNDAKDAMIKLMFDPEFVSPEFSIIVSKYEEEPYPSAELEAFFKQYNLTTALPSFEMADVTYSYFEYGSNCYLTMEPSGENTVDAIISNAESALVKAGFKVAYGPRFDGQEGLMARYIDPALQYFVFFMADEASGSVSAIIAVDVEGEMADAVFLDYPQEIINLFVPEYTTDALPSLAVEGSVYMIGEDGDGFQLQINLQPGMEAANILSNLTTRIGRAGYLFDEDDEGYHSANNQIVIYINNIDNKMLEIQVRFIEEEEPPVEEEENVTYTFICDNTNFDITSDDARIFLYVWDAEGNVDWIELYYEESGQNQKEFEVEISNKWIGCQVVRFAPDSEIAWKPSDEESTVTIWNRTSEREDVSLDGKGGEVHFTLY